MKTKLIIASLLATQVIAFAADFVAHEWGTFTSVQGADGVQLEWNPLVVTDLPKFVYGGHRLKGAARLLKESLAKDASVSLQRMETPVIYFYADKELTVDVSVGFPQGRVTEWYPQTTPNTNRQTRWNNVTILPARDETRHLLDDGSKTHYYAARATDAALLRVPAPKQQSEHEKFLFYRGVGSFRAPLAVRMGVNEDFVQLHNWDATELRHFFILQVQGQSARLARLDKLPKDAGQQVKLNSPGRPLSEVSEEIAAGMRRALTSEGLYAREAAAMVETWRESWFNEQGVRVLYVLPRDWTDRTLPLSINPRPREVARVMVGRAEVITPSMDWKLMKEIVRFSEGDADAVARVQALGMGRFADAAVRRMLGQTPAPSFSKAAWKLLESALPEPTGAKLAVK